MARLHEYQGKALLSDAGIKVPKGIVVSTPQESRRAAEKLSGKVVVKAQAWVTGRKALGGVVFAENPQEAESVAEKMFKLCFGNFPVTELLVEEVIDIKEEYFVSLTIDDARRAPILLLDFHGGSGIEDRADKIIQLPVNSLGDLDVSGLPKETDSELINALCLIVKCAKSHEARSFEVNPLVKTSCGQVLAADCRVTIDDYAVFRHKDLGIEIARELDHPPTDLEKIAYEIEQSDHRGTFYFASLPIFEHESSEGLIGFHGAGGGGSMMSMDAVSNKGFTLSNFTDTSGNPSVAKVYKAARVILSQKNLKGYFGSGSGVASQEQYHSAYGLAKAFIETGLSIPAVIRLGGNSEDRAVKILEDACKKLDGTVEGYKKDDTPDFCASRFKVLVKQFKGITNNGMKRNVPEFVGSVSADFYEISGGKLWIDTLNCSEKVLDFIVENSSGLFKINNGKLDPIQELQDKDSELIACEIECFIKGHPVFFVDLPIEGLD